MTGLTRTRAALVALLVLACCVAGVVTVQAADDFRPAAPAAGAKQPAPRLRPATAAPGQRVRATGRLDSKVVRKVVLQRKEGASWRRLAGARTNDRGRYRLSFVAPAAAVKLRVKAPAVDKRGRHYRQLVSAAARLVVTGGPTPSPTPTPTPTPVPVTVDLEVPTHALAGGPRPDAVVRTTGAPAGTPVTLQRLSGTHWVGVATATVDGSGTTRVPLPLGDLGPGATSVRAVVSGVVSPARDLDVGSPGAILTPEDDSEVDGPVDVEIEVAAGLIATQVRLYLDGFVLDDLAEPVPGEPGHWQASVDPASVPLTRRHVDLVARVITADGSALTAPVRLDLLPTTGGLPPGFRVDTVASGLDLPTSLAILDEHRMFVTEKAGLVRLAVDGLVRPTPVIDLRGVVSDTADSGILAVALDPDFAVNGWFYLAYVADDGGNTLWHTNRVVRYTLVGEVADPASAHVVLGTVPLDTCLADQTTPGCLATHGTHTVDDLLFAADGSLLVSVGDGAPGQPARAVLAQRLDVLVGKVLRVDPDSGLGLADNPYFVTGQPGANRSRVWAYGFRNPFRMAFSPAGDLYVGDVGEVAWEEVDRIVAGGNYGWPCFEGLAGPGTAPAGDPDCEAVRTGAVVHRTPLLAYAHVDFSGSITLGAFADGDAYPAPYQGRLFLGDYTQSKVWTLDVDPPAPDEPRLDDFGSPPGLGAGVKYVAGPDGDIWYADIASGSIRRIVYEPEPTTCPSGQFLMETFRNRELEPEPEGQPWVTSCVGTPPPGPQPRGSR